MTDVEILEAARLEVQGKVAEYDEKVRNGGGPRPRLAHLREVAAGLDRLIREQHEAYQ